MVGRLKKATSAVMLSLTLLVAEACPGEPSKNHRVTASRIKLARDVWIEEAGDFKDLENHAWITKHPLRVSKLVRENWSQSVGSQRLIADALAKVAALTSESAAAIYDDHYRAGGKALNLTSAATRLTKRQADVLLDWAQICAAVKKTTDATWPDLDSSLVWTERDFRNAQEMLCLWLYTLLPPQWNDWRTVKVRNFNASKDNFIDVAGGSRKVVFNEHRTAASYGSRAIPIKSSRLWKLIQAISAVNDSTDHLFVNWNDEPYPTSGSFSYFVSATFQRTVGIPLTTGIIRKSYLRSLNENSTEWTSAIELMA